MAELIRILVADDHAVVREGLAALIATEPGMALVGEASDGREAAAKARRLRPHVILLDQAMPREDGFEAIGAITREDAVVRVLVLTSFAEDEGILPAIKSGAQGYLLKDSSPQELLQAIRDVYHGEPSLHPVIARRLVREISRPSELVPTAQCVTEREFQVLNLVAGGLSLQEIAGAFATGKPEVCAHIRSILRKLHLVSLSKDRPGIPPSDLIDDTDNYGP